MSIYLKLLLAICIWGFALSLTKHALSEMSPVTLITLRCSLGWLALWGFGGFRNCLAGWTRAELLKLFVISTSGVWFHQLVQAYALSRTSAHHAGWLVGAAPLVTAAVMRYMFSEKLGRLVAAGFGLGFAGGLLIVFSKQSLAGGAIVPTGFGDVIFISSMLTWAFYSIFSSRWFVGRSFLKLTQTNMALGALAMLPIFLFGGYAPELGALSVKGWSCVLYLGLLSSALGYYFWNLGVEELGPSRASAFLYLEPLTALLGGTLLLGEQPSAAAALGGLLILYGVYWINGGRAGVRPLRAVYGLFARP